MPRFFFDVREGDFFAPDTEGTEFDSLDAAELEAAKAAADVGRDRLPVSDAREITIEVRDEQRRPVVKVTVSLVIERTGARPSGV